MTQTATPEITNDQMVEATLYAAGYEGTFDFMQDMRAKALNDERLSPRMVAAILRCKTREDERTAASVPSRSLPTLEGKCFYLLNGETVFRAKKSRSTGNVYAERLTMMGHGQGSFCYDRGHANILRSGLADGTVVQLTVEEAARLGHHYGICVICSATLTDPRSVAAGIGPVCARNTGLAR
jgi:hypothetical protein